MYGKNFIIFDQLLDDIGKYNHLLPTKVQSAYIPLQDEDKSLIAVDIITEKGSIIERPTFLRLGYRWNEKEDHKKWNPLIREGFNVVKVDVRGAGASTGTREVPWSENELMDIDAIVEWIINQPWSDGHIITFGSDYSATTSELSARGKNPALKAHVCHGNEYNLYSDIIFPGGIFHKSYVKSWSGRNTLVEKSKIQSVNDPLYNPVISEIKHQHEQNVDVWDLFSNIEYVNDNLDAKNKIPLSTINLSTYSDEISRNKAPKFNIGSWFDTKSANAIIHRFLNYSNPFIGVIGPWDHALKHVYTLTKPRSPSFPTQLVSLLEYIRFAKKALSNPTSIPKKLYYYTVGEEKWKVTETWPLPTQKINTLYLHAKNKLSFEPPIKGEKSIYHVNTRTTSGTSNRWTTPFGTGVNYSNRAKQDRRCLIFTSPPISDSIEITGHPLVTLQLSSSHEDGALFTYLEAIYKRKVYYLTEGQLRLIYRKDSARKPYSSPTIFREFTKSNAELLKPNIVYDFQIPLEPLSVRLPENCRLRLSISGTDVDNFKSYPEMTKPYPEWTIYHNSEFISAIKLPIILNKEESEN